MGFSRVLSCENVLRYVFNVSVCWPLSPVFLHYRPSITVRRYNRIDTRIHINVPTIHKQIVRYSPLNAPRAEFTRPRRISKHRISRAKWVIYSHWCRRPSPRTSLGLCAQSTVSLLWGSFVYCIAAESPK